MLKSTQSVHPYSNIWRFLVANAVIALLVMILFYGSWHSSLKDFLLSFLWAYTICITQWIGHGYINNKINEKYSWRDNPAQRIIFGGMAIILYATVAFIAVQLIMLKLILNYFPTDFWQWALKSSIYAIAISLGVTLIFTAHGFFKAWKKTLLEAEQFKNQMLTYKYEALQNQINPHFLFNSFNVLTDLVYSDQKQAVNFIRQLSQLFRYVLDNREKELININEELDFIQSYIYLLKTRFEDKLMIQINMQAEPDEFIVPMALQLLIENCVKHNEISTQKPLNIDVEREEDYILVRNTLQPKNAGDDSKKTGLDNIKQQYRFFTDKELIIESNPEFYSVKIPVIKSAAK